MSQMYSWLERAIAAGLAASDLLEEVPKVPSQRWRAMQAAEGAQGFNEVGATRRKLVATGVRIVRRELCHRHFPPVSLPSQHRTKESART